jgi:hypothetical protein
LGPSVFFTVTRRQGLMYWEYVQGIGQEMALHILKLRRGESELIHILEYKRF